MNPPFFGRSKSCDISSHAFAIVSMLTRWPRCAQVCNFGESLSFRGQVRERSVFTIQVNINLVTAFLPWLFVSDT